MMVLSAILAFLLASSTPQTLQTPDPNRIEDVRVQGNRRIPSDTIRFNLQTKPGDQFNFEVVRRDIKTLYALQHFDDVRVDEEEGKSGKIVVFTVKEKPLVRSIDYIGMKSVTKSDILDRLREKKVGLSQESPYDPTRIKRAEAVIKGLLSEKGFQNAAISVDTEDIPPNAIAVTFNVTEGPKVKIETIAIEGNKVFSDRQIRKAMKLIKQAGGLATITGKDTYHELKLADDITRIRILYAEHGYVRSNVLDPEVEVKPTRVFRTLPFIKPAFPWGLPIPFFSKKVDRYYLTIKIEENDQYRVGDVKVTGAKEFQEEGIKAVLGLLPGEIYNESLLRKGFENLKKLYGSRGYINFTPVPVQDFDEEKKVVNLNINIDEDRKFFVNRIAFAGNTTTRDKVIRREVMVDEGNVFNSQLWDMSLLRLNQLGYFEEIKNEDAEVKPHPNENNVDITLKVKEKGRNSIGFSGGVSGIGGSFVGLSYQTNNFLGFGENLSFDVQGGTRQSNFVFSYTEPYLLDRPISAGFSVFSRNFRFDQAREFFGLDPTNLPDGLGFENRLNYEQKRAGFSLYVSYPLRVFHRLGLTYSWDNSETDAVNPATRDYFQVVTQQERESFIRDAGGSFGRYRSRRITPTYTYNSTNHPMNPNTGQAFTASLELSGGVFGGNVNLLRPSFEYKYFRPINRGRNVLAFRVLGSQVRGFKGLSVPFFERVFMGGDFDVRGFDFRAVSPISFVSRAIDVLDPETGDGVKRAFDDIVYLGGDTQGVFNFEYRIPLVGPITLAPFLDVGNTWITRKQELLREVTLSDGRTRLENARFLAGTNSGIRSSTGVELQVIMPVINAPFRLIFAYNPNRIDRTYFGNTTGIPFLIREKRKDIKFTVGRTF